MPRRKATLVRDVVDSARIVVEADTGPDPIDVEAVSPIEAQSSPVTTRRSPARLQPCSKCPYRRSVTPRQPGDDRFDTPKPLAPSIAVEGACGVTEPSAR